MTAPRRDRHARSAAVQTARETTMTIAGPLIDSFGRVHDNLRVSVTDRCNIRCFYCMPQERVRFKPRSEILRFEEIERFVRVAVQLGVRRLRITGGEPLMRAGLPVLVRRLAGIPGVDDLAMTTNGMLLAEQSEALRAAGLRRLNISLDALREDTFRTIARRDGLPRVLAGIAAAQAAGFDKIRLNTVAIRGITEDEVIALAEFARQHDLELRFIEFMPLDADGNWNSQHVLPGAAVRRQLEQHFGPLVPVTRTDPSQPAVDYAFRDGSGRVGFINPVTEPFCGECSRLRITAEGQVRNCLFSTVEWDARAVLRSAASDAQLAELIKECVGAKRAGHGIDSPEFLRPRRAMYELGG
jgi:cyclic pyranopterin phosphate synthase